MTVGAAPQISVIVPTYQRSGLLRSCVESFDTQIDAPEFEVVVAVNGSTDDTATVLVELAARRPWLRSVHLTPNRGPAAARNAALAEATGELVVFVDDDIVATPTLLAKHAAYHRAAEDEALTVLGRVDWHPSLTVTPFMHWLDHSRLQFAYETGLTEGPVEVPFGGFYTANLSIRRQRLVDVGGFDDRFPFGYEDLEIAVRLTKQGLRMHYRPDALAYHCRSIDRQTFARRMTIVGRATPLMLALAPDFPVDDRALRRHLTSRRRRLALGVRAKVVRTEKNLWDFYWATIAAAYDEGLRDPIDVAATLSA